MDYREDETSTGDNRGKFSERLKKINKDRKLFKKYGFMKKDGEELGIVTLGRNVLKVFLVSPSIIYSHIIGNDKKENVKINDSSSFFRDKEINIINNDLKKMKVNKIRDMDISLLKRKRDFIEEKNIFLKSSKLSSVSLMLDAEIRKNQLQKEIIDLIKKSLIKNINEFEILQSELYILKEFELDNIYYDRCQDNIKEIKKLLSRINSLKEKYDYLKDNVDFQYMLEFDDNLLIDKIVELKELCSRDDIRNVIDDYKILEEYKYLYLKIDKLQEDAIIIEEERNKKVLELKDRDINFDKLKDDMYNIDKEKERYDSFVKQQELLLKNLDEMVDKIDSYNSVTYRLKGFNKLLGNSFKYLGLLLVNPLKGLIPGIVTQTVVTKNLVHNLYNNLSLEENKKIVYEAVDYSVEINSAINNLDATSSLIDSTLEEIILLKNKYKNDFSKYSDSLSNYKDVIKKLNKIENSVLGSKVKVNSIKLKMKEKEIVNNNKLKRVKVLNSSNK